VESLVNASFRRDFVCDASVENPYVLHRKAGARDIYMVYGVPKGAQCTFRSVGAVELWDVWSGDTKALPVLSQNDGITKLQMPLEETEAQLIVFAPGKPQISAGSSVESPERIPVQGAWEFELKPTLDNRWGDYRLPASNTFIGVEARRFRYAEANASQTGWANPSLDDSAWETVAESYGPHFWKLGPFPAGADLTQLEARLAKLTSVDPSKPVEFAGTQYRWQSYQYSMRWGPEQDPGHQGYHGLKGEMPKDFITLGKPRTKSTTIVYEPEPTGVRYFLWTSAAAPRAMDARLCVGGEIMPAIWVNGTPLASGASSAHLKGGSNPVLLRYDKPGRGYFMLEDPSSPAGWKQTYPLASPWYNKPGVLPLDTRPEVSRPTGWYRFTAPPGLRSMKIAAHGSVRVWVAGRPAAVKPGTKRQDGSVEYTATVAHVSTTTENVTLRVNQQRGVYGGAAIAEPIALECGPGKIAPGDWSLIDGLASYSGGAFYKKTITLTARQAQGRVVLDLGKVSASVEVRVNGQKTGVRVAPPWKVDLSRHVRSGENRIELLIFNTLANHYQTIPTRYRGSSVSGLIGPVNLEVGKE
ncbi:MAG: glycosylhydrolase-like jelly roll fold domain-containing protein, partial [Bryobacteraceae bacterium]